MSQLVKKCQGCGKPWTPKRRHAQTCKHACRQRLYRRRKAERRRAEKSLAVDPCVELAEYYDRLAQQAVVV